MPESESFVPVDAVRPYVLEVMPDHVGVAARSSQLGGVRVSAPAASLWLPSGLALVRVRPVSWGYSPNRFAGARVVVARVPVRGGSRARVWELGVLGRSGGRHAAGKRRLSPA